LLKRLDRKETPVSTLLLYDMARAAKFLVSRFSDNPVINNAMIHMLQQTGVKVTGPGTERLTAIDEQPLGQGAIVTTRELCIGQGGPYNADAPGKWMQDFGHFCNLTEFGCLILAGPLKNWHKWRRTALGRDEVRQVSEDRLFVYLVVDDVGYIVHVSGLQSNQTSTTVSNGKGAIIWGDGGYYEGGIKDGRMHGIGEAHYANGNTYSGEWADGMQHGMGQSHYGHRDSGRRYEGGFRAGKYHGMGTFHYKDGSVYEGERVDGKKHGHGTISYASGDRHEGEFKNGKMNGEGRVQCSECR
jgi:hypothetical protein